MGNSEAGMEQAVESGTAKETIERLNIGDGNDGNLSEEEASKYLIDYLNKLSDKELNDLLSQWGVSDEIISQFGNDKNKKIECLRKVSSSDYWRVNASIHPNFKRVKMWLKVHSNYRQYLNDILKLTNDYAKSKDGSLLSQIEKDFEKFESKLTRHTDFEENYLFKFFSSLNNDNNYKGLKCLYLDTMHEQHIHSDCYPTDASDKKQENKEKENQNESKNENEKKSKDNDGDNGIGDGSWPSTTKDVKSAFAGNEDCIAKLNENMKTYCDEMMNHLLMEERSLIHVWLNITSDEQKKFNDSLTWVYWVAYGKSS